MREKPTPLGGKEGYTWAFYARSSTANATLKMLRILVGFASFCKWLKGMVSKDPIRSTRQVYISGHHLQSVVCAQMVQAIL